MSLRALEGQAKGVERRVFPRSDASNLHSAEYAIRYVFQMGNASGKQAIYRRKYEAWGLLSVEWLGLGLELRLQRQTLIESNSELVQLKNHKSLPIGHL